MGCFNISCAVSHITIHSEERVFLFPLLPNISNYERRLGYPDNGCATIGPCSMLFEVNEIYTPFCFPIEGIYDDYGSIENIVETENTKAIEKYLGIDIHDFVDLITENRGKDTYDSCSCYYEYFFDRKELLEDDISFEDFLIGIGFEAMLDSYRYPGSNYSICAKQTESGKEYILAPDTEAETHMIKFLKKRGETQLKLHQGYDMKKDLLELHLHMTGKRIGIKQPDTLDLVSKMSAMFVHGEVFDQLTKPDYKLGEHPEEINISEYFLLKLGFIFVKEGDIYLKDNIRVKRDDYSATIGSGNITYNVYSCKEFMEAYETLSGEKCNLCEIEDYDGKQFLFKDLQLQYTGRKNFINSIRKVIYEDDDIDWFFWSRGIIGLMMFRDWKYFLPIYQEKIEDGSIESDYVKYMRFHEKMYQLNVSFMPTFQGIQGGDTEAEKELLETVLRIVNRRLEFEKE